MASKRIWRAAPAAALFLLIQGAWVHPVEVNAAFQRDSGVVEGFTELIAYVEKIPTRVLTSPQRLSLLSKLNTARKQYLDAKICPAHTTMTALLNETQLYRAGGSVAVAEVVYGKGRSLRDSFFDAFLADPGLPRPACFDRGVRQPPKVGLRDSNNLHVSATLTFGAPRVSTSEAGGETWTEITLPGLQPQIGEPGAPALPTWQTLVAIPRGSTPVLTQGAIAVRESIRLNAYPFQHQASDGASAVQGPRPGGDVFLDKPFVKDPKAYVVSAFVPAAPCAIRSLGQLRDLHIAQVQCAAGQYNPVTDELRLFESLNFDVRFDGGDGAFITSQSLDPFEKGSASALLTVLNSEAASDYVVPVDGGNFTCVGEELLILTHPWFRAEADQLAVWKRTKGIATRVFEVGSGTVYDTGRKINRLIDNRYDKCRPRLSYVLIMGDSELVPPARTDYDTRQEPDPTTGSDWGYATYSVNLGPIEIESTLPYFAVGRIPVDDPSYAGIVVRKSIEYESAPPFVNFLSGAPFYTTATIASYFQCCRADFFSNFSEVSITGREMRGYIQSSEKIRNVMMTHGHTVERVYNTNTDLAGSVSVLDATPRRYYDGDALPWELGPASAFPWDGFPRDIIDAFEQGRFLIIHRDHGVADSWVNPPFSSSHADGLRNKPLYPVVYSINCRTGYWDSETDGDPSESIESLMEKLLRGNHGMVGGIAANRDTPQWPNNALLRGLIDATWPNMAPEFGGATPVRRLGDILNYAKIYLATQVGLSQPIGSKVTEQNYRDEVILYHLLGDPTLEMWTSNPHVLDLSTSVDITAEPGGLVASYPVEGAEITALQVMANGSLRPLARGTVSGGVARLPFVQGSEKVGLGSIRLSASLPNAVSVPLSISSRRNVK